MNTNYFLTSDDEEWLRQVQLCEQVASESLSVDPQEVTVNPLLIPSLLTRARLSEATRRAEEKRLASLERKRNSLRNRKPRNKNYRPYTEKQATRRRNNRKKFNKYAGFGAILKARGYKQLDKEMWDKYITPLYQEYSPQYLSIKLYKHVPMAKSRRDGYDKRCYYGTKEYPFTVYTLDVIHSLLGVVYSGKEKYEQDVQAEGTSGNFQEESLSNLP